MNWSARESFRQVLAVVPVPLSLLVPGSVLVKVLASWDVYAAGYLLLTWLAYRRREPAELRAIALASRRRPLADRLISSAPEQLSQLAASIALTTTVNAMPQAGRLGTSPALVLGVCVVAVVTSWLVLQVGCALGYLGLYAEQGGLDFPGDEQPAMTEFLYFAVSVGTTFGTTDVTVTRRRMRRQVLVHGVLAFVFNTLVLAVALTILTSYLPGA